MVGGRLQVFPMTEAEHQEYARLRQKWEDTKGTPEHHAADWDLGQFFYQRTKRLVEEDKRKHPKAKRNQPKPVDLPPAPYEGIVD